GANEEIGIRMAAPLDAAAAPARADLEAGAIVAERIGTILVEKGDRHEELRGGAVPVRDVSDLLQIALIPRAYARGAGAPIAVFDPVAERIERLRQLPGEDAARPRRIGDDGGVAAVAHAAVATDDSVLRPHLPEVSGGVAMMLDAGEQAFGA